MAEPLRPEEVAILIRARQIQKDKGLIDDIDISGICKTAGISRKTGYQWAEKHLSTVAREQQALEERLARLQSDHAKLKQDFDQVSFENRGRKLAWPPARRAYGSERRFTGSRSYWLQKKTHRPRTKRKSGRVPAKRM